MYPVTALAASPPMRRIRSARRSGKSPSTNAVMFGACIRIRNVSTRTVTSATTPDTTALPALTTGPLVLLNDFRIFGRFSLTHFCTPRSFSV